MEERLNEKNSFVIQVYQVAEDLNIPRTVVSNILYEFIAYIKVELCQSKEVRLLGLANILPDNKQSYVSTVAYQSMKVSNKIGISYFTCLQVVKYYLEYLRKELSSGICIDIRSLFSIHPIYENGEVVSYHSSLSDSVKRDVPNLRVHTCRLLKGKLNDWEDS